MFDDHVEAFWRDRETTRRRLGYVMAFSLFIGTIGAIDLLRRTSAWAVVAFTGSFALIVASMLFRADLRPPRSRRFPVTQSGLSRGETRVR